MWRGSQVAGRIKAAEHVRRQGDIGVRRVFEAEPGGDPGESRLVQTAIFEPRGLFGLAYWYGLYPLHQLVFSGMIDAIQRRAETLKEVP